MELDAGTKVSDYVAEAKNLAYQLQQAEEPVSDEMLQTMIIDRLPLIKYKGFILSWNGKDRRDRSLVKLEAELISAEEIMKAEDEKVVALAAAARKIGPGKQPQKETDKGIYKKFTGKCYFCKKVGHKKEECRKAREYKTKSKSIEKGKSTHQLPEMSTEERGDVFVARASIAEANLVPEDTWLADSEASFHMSYDVSVFENMTESKHKKNLLGDNRTLEVIGEGDVCINILQEGKWKPWRLTKYYTYQKFVAICSRILHVQAMVTRLCQITTASKLEKVKKL